MYKVRTEQLQNIAENCNAIYPRLQAGALCKCYAKRYKRRHANQKGVAQRTLYMHQRGCATINITIHDCARVHRQAFGKRGGGGGGGSGLSIRSPESDPNARGCAWDSSAVNSFNVFK